MPSIAELLLTQGRIAGDAKRSRGAMLGNTIETLAQVPGQIMHARDQQRAQKAEGQQAQQADAAKRLEAAQKAAIEHLKQTGGDPKLFSVWVQNDAPLLFHPEALPRLQEIAGDPEQIRQFAAGILGTPKKADYTLGNTRRSGDTNEVLAEAPQAPAAPRTRMVSTRQPDGTTKHQIVEDTVGQEFIEAPEQPKPAAGRVVTVPGPDGRPITRLATEDELKVGVPAYERPRVSTGSGSTDNEPLTAVMGDDGKSVLMRRSQAEGRQPASSREQGRAVTSGDANRIADYDTAIHDLKTLRGEVAQVAGSTGTSAKFGASLWNPITELTGIGATAKSKQAVIDRVKQVIGKALEGGVLRKEDEIKYAKILPTIGDVESVVKSKLDGLEAAIKQRRLTTLDALADAGYDTSRFNERTGTKKADPLGIR